VYLVQRNESISKVQPTRCSVAKAEWEITQPWQRPVTTWVYKPEAASTV
jgi:hypothetical protein